MFMLELPPVCPQFGLKLVSFPNRQRSIPVTTTWTNTKLPRFIWVVCPRLVRLLSAGHPKVDVFVNQIISKDRDGIKMVL